MDDVSSPARQQQPIRRWFVYGSILALLVAVGVLVSAYRASQAMPDFYVAAVERRLEPAAAKQAADAAETEILAARNEITRGEGDWRLVLREDEINSWLSTQLAQKMPGLLPKAISEPRVVLKNGLIQIACRYNSTISGVLSLELEPSLTGEPNTLAIGIRSLKLGALPIPQQTFIDEVTKSAANNNLPLQWIEQEGKSIAIVTIPVQDSRQKNREFHLETVIVSDGQLEISGTSKAL